MNVGRFNAGQLGITGGFSEQTRYWHLGLCKQMGNFK